MATRARGPAEGSVGHHRGLAGGLLMAFPEAKELCQDALDLGVTLAAGTLERIGKFLDLLVLWNRRIRLTGDRDRRLLVRKHVVDSLAVLPELPASGLLLDIGSGGGFPGVVLGCARPDLDLRLVEPRRRPASFLSEAIRTIPLPHAQVVAMRGEDVAAEASLGGRAQVVVSRALRLDLLLGIAVPLLAPAGIIIALQTPSTNEAVTRDRLRQLGLGLLRVRDYRLAGGEARRLLVFGRS